MTDKEPSSEKKDPVADLSAMLGMGGLLEGMTGILSKFGELAERGESLHKTMEGKSASGTPFKSSMGFSVKFAGDRSSADNPSVAPINPASKPSTSTASARAASSAGSAPKLREPNVDIFEEEDHTLLVAEMPGVASEAIELSFDDKSLQISGSSPTAVFKKQLELPRVYTRDQVTVTANNGVIEIHLKNA